MSDIETLPRLEEAYVHTQSEQLLDILAGKVEGVKLVKMEFSDTFIPLYESPEESGEVLFEEFVDIPTDLRFDKHWFEGVNQTELLYIGDAHGIGMAWLQHVSLVKGVSQFDIYQQVTRVSNDITVDKEGFKHYKGRFIGITSKVLGLDLSYIGDYVIDEAWATDDDGNLIIRNGEKIKVFNFHVSAHLKSRGLTNTLLKREIEKNGRQSLQNLKEIFASGEYRYLTEEG